MISFLDVLITVVFLLVLAVPGFIFAKIKSFPKTASETLSFIVLYACSPVVIFTSFQGCAYDPKIALNMLIVVGMALLTHFVMFAILKLVFKKWGKEEKTSLVKYFGVFGNCGFMGLPFLQSLFTDPALQAEIIVYCAAVLTVFNVLNWTFGVYILTGDKQQISVKKVLLNPIIIGVVFSLLVFFIMQKPLIALAAEGTIAYKVLTKLMNSLNFLSNMVTPLSMFVIGIRLANVNLRQLFADKWAYSATIMKLIVMSLVAICIVAILPVANTIKYTIFFLFSMPSATSGVMMAVQFKKDSDFAAKVVVLSTICSSVTLPLMYLLMNSICGL